MITNDDDACEEARWLVSEAPVDDVANIDDKFSCQSYRVRVVEARLG
jgi:hypothetical protein